MERRCPARCHSAVEGPAEPITVKGRLSSLQHYNQTKPHLLEVLFVQQAVDLLTKTAPFGSLVSRLLRWNGQSSSLQTRLSCFRRAAVSPKHDKVQLL